MIGTQGAVHTAMPVDSSILRIMNVQSISIRQYRCLNHGLVQRALSLTALMGNRGIRVICIRGGRVLTRWDVRNRGGIMDIVI